MAKKNIRKSDIGKIRVIAYVRVSSDKQAQDGSSLEAQTAKLHAYAAAFDLEIVRIEVDAGASASSLDRPALKRALACLDSFEASALLVVKLDRLTRSLRDLADLVDTYFKDGQYSLLSVSENIDTRSAAGRLVLNILTTVSQWEREAAGERTAAVMQHMKATGQFCGGWPPYGFTLDEDGSLHECLEEQAIIVRARALRTQGHTLRAVAAALPINPRTGKPFAAQQIVRML
jgi:site-specific DNA recombinase